MDKQTGQFVGVEQFLALTGDPSAAATTKSTVKTIESQRKNHQMAFQSANRRY